VATARRGGETIIPDLRNIADVLAWLNIWVDAFKFGRIGKDQSRDYDIANEVVQPIQERSLTEKHGVVGEWDPNAPNYVDYKEKRFQVANAPNQRTGQMLSQKLLHGRTRIKPKLVTMVYGINVPSGRAITGVPPAKADTKVTDIEKANFTHTGQSKKAFFAESVGAERLRKQRKII